VATGLGDGEINTRHLLRLLSAMGYTGPLCLEGPRAGDREWFAQQDIAYLRRLLAELSPSAELRA
jgi:sugar phosphate isomerase/epimerase